MSTDLGPRRGVGRSRRLLLALAASVALILLASAGAWGGGGAASAETVTTAATVVHVQGVATGAGHTCVLTTGGGVECWGDNQYGELGDGTTTSRLTPAPVSGLDSGVQEIASGGLHSCALTSAGGVECWGDNQFGELGDGTTTDRSTPVAVSGLESGVEAIAVGYWVSCALTSDGGVKCWGYNGDGQLGDGTTTSRLTPGPVSGLDSGVQAIASGGLHSCALTSGGGVECWGDNQFGELGDGTATARSTPVAVSRLESGIEAIAVGYWASCALTSGGAVKCWGYNGDGQLGDGTRTDRHTPVTVSGLDSGAQAIAAGGAHSCALTGAGLECWGSNDAGQLGDGTTSNRLTPVPVPAFSVLVPLTVVKGGHGSGRVRTSPAGIDCGSVCSATFLKGTSVSLSAAPYLGSAFMGWSGACSGTSACTLAMTSARSVQATFTKLEPLTVVKRGSGSGRVRSSPAGIDCGSVCTAAFLQGAKVSLKAAAARHSDFVRWSGACAGKRAACPLTMGASRSVRATFKAVCVVPRLVGRSLVRAKRAIRKAGCSVGRTPRVYSGRRKGLVLSQKPRPGAHVSRRARVNFVVSRGQKKKR